MALTNSEKDFLRDRIKWCINHGKSKNETLTMMVGCGYKLATAKKYYEIFSKPTTLKKS